MPIRISGPLPIEEIAEEFLDTNLPNALTEYYGDGQFLSKGYFPTTPPISNRRRPNTPAGDPNENNSISISEFYGRGRRFPINIVIRQNTANYNPIDQIKAAISSNNIPLNVEVDVTITINSGVTVFGTSTNQNSPALVIPPDDETRNTGLRAADALTIINNGNIVGAPGAGGAGGNGCGAGGAAGGGGGVALWARRRISVQNNGIIAGGAPGGSGGTGGQARQGYSCNCQRCCGTCQQRTQQCRQGGSCNNGGGGRCTQGKQQRSLQKQCVQMAQRRYSCNCSDCNCQTCYRYNIRIGGAGGNGATVFSNSRIGGGGAGGNPAGYETTPNCGPTNGNSGGLWGEGGSLWLRGANNVPNFANIGGTKLGSTS